MSELAADGIPVAVSCRVVKLARQPFYRWLANPISDSELVEAYRANALFDAHLDDPEIRGNLRNRQITPAGDSDQVPFELIWIPLRHNDILPAGDETRAKSVKSTDSNPVEIAPTAAPSGGLNELGLPTPNKTSTGYA